MEEARRPTIKGVFVKSHIRGLERARGRSGLIELQRRFGRPVHYGNTDNVPVKDEVEILEHIVDMYSQTPLSRDERATEAGRLHFRDFKTTTLGSIISPFFGLSPKLVFMQCPAIGGYVFRNVEFIAQDTGEHAVKIILFNNDYPLEHFKGFFEEWLSAFDLTGTVTARASGSTRYEYDIEWQ